MSFKAIVRNKVARSGYLVTEIVQPTFVRDLLSKLHPVSTTFDLVRIGGAADGGYLLPDDLDGIVACFSPGVDVVATFESDMVARGIPCFLADASVVEAPLKHPLIDFEPLFVGGRDEGNIISLETWIARKLPGIQGDLLLQMDIEGSEWATLLSTPASVLRRFRIVVLELHHLSRIFDVFGIDVIRAVLLRLIDEFHLVHVHPNNNAGIVSNSKNSVSDVIEVTFLRKDRSQSFGPVTELPHPLDRDCIPSKAHVSRAFCVE